MNTANESVKRNELVYIDQSNEYHGGQMAIFRGSIKKWASVSIIDPLNVKTFLVSIEHIKPLGYYLTENYQHAKATIL